jgi:transcriptional regulator with XRE-family HTH domain
MRRWVVADDDAAAAQRALSKRLKQLRAQLVPGRTVRQIDVATAIGASNASVSSWENPSAAPLPEERLEPLARFFATQRSIGIGDGRPVLLDGLDLTSEENSRRLAILDELTQLRARALAASAPLADVETGAAGGWFWYFPDGQPIRIITSRLSRKALTSPSARDVDRDPAHEPIPYCNPWHPNYVRSLWDGDRDATTEVYGQIRAENPLADVRFVTADRVTDEDLTGHVVILGQGEAFSSDGALLQATSSTLGYMIKRQEWPWFVRLPPSGDEEYDSEFVVTLDDSLTPAYYAEREITAKEEVHRPVFLTGGEALDETGRRLIDGFPQLEYDVAVVARRHNQLNLSTTLTICSGIFSRGTLGAVRAFTDPKLRTRNEQWIYDNVDPDDFWMLLQVPVFPSPHGARTVTPDLEREFLRLRVSNTARRGPAGP